MRTYSVFEPPALPGNLEEDAQSFVFVRHGWSLLALFVPPIWMIMRKLWIVLAVYVVLVIGIQLLGLVVHPAVIGAISGALAIILLLEAGQLQLESWAAKGYREVAVIQAKNQNEAERLFLSGWLAEREEKVAEQTVRSPVRRPISATPPALPGL